MVGTAAAGLAYAAYRQSESSPEPEIISEPEELVPTEEVEAEPEVETVELIPQSSERFLAEQSGYTVFTQLHKKEVLYVDAQNRPVGEPVVLESFVGELPEGVTVPEGQVPEYLYSIGEVDATGLPIGKVPPRWLDYKQAELQAEHPDQLITRRMHAIADFQAAHRETDEPELVAGIENGSIDSYDDIVSYFAEKPVRGTEHLNRMEYTRERLQFRSQAEAGRPGVPENIQAEFRRILPGLFAQESKFNAGLVSSTGARGLAQIMPETWEEYRGTREVSLSLTEQLDVAGELISDNYHYITHFGGEEAVAVLRGQYNSDKEFETGMMVPLMVNAYNAGGPLLGMVVKEFVENTNQADLQTGPDLFLQLADYAQTRMDGVFENYQIHAREYTARVYGNVAMLEQKYQQ